MANIINMTIIIAIIPKIPSLPRKPKLIPFHMVLSNKFILNHHPFKIIPGNNLINPA